MSERHEDYPLTTAQTSYDLLGEIERLAIEEPARIDMLVVCYRGKDLLNKIKENLADKFRTGTGKIVKASSCNTVGCIAGWVLVRTGNAPKNYYNGNNTDGAEDLLGLTVAQGKELFYPNHLVSIGGSRQTRAHARAVVAHIRTFKAKYKDQLMAHKIVVNREGEA